MKPSSKIVQIQSMINTGGAHFLYVLCEDGSLWELWPNGNLYKLVHKGT